ncbi:MAG: FAD-binding protein [Dehalococcoidales bacterium]|nr:FAD-binding protein [Dehalococcoidales bacterium]
MDQRLIDELRRAVAPERVLTTPEDLTVYAYDGTWLESRPDVAVVAASAAEVAATLRLANREGIPVVPRGAGSGLAGGAVPARGGIVLSMTLMRRIVEIDTVDMVAVAEAGVVNATLQAAVEAKGFFYPPDPASLRQSTIGGNVATSASGPRCLKYGGTKDYLLALQVVLPDGTIIRTGGRMIKSVAGYNLAQLFTGSEGTLGVIAEATVRIIPLPKARGTAMAVFPRLDDAGEAVTTLLGAGVVPLALEMMDQTAIRCVEEYLQAGLPVDAEAILLVDVDGDETAVAEQLALVADAFAQSGAAQVQRAATKAEADVLWAARRAVSPSLARLKPNKLGEDISVPRSAIPGMVRGVAGIAKRHDLVIPLFGHIGDGNLHPNIVCDLRDKEEMARVIAAAREIFALALSLGGTLSGEHGIGLLKREFLAGGVDPGALALMKAIKATVDPKGIMNPGKVY